MAEELKAYACKHCGKMFEEEGHANTCEALHIDSDDLHISHIEQHLPSGKAYDEGDRMPAALMVKGINADASSLYIKFDLSQLKRAAEGIMLP